MSEVGAEKGRGLDLTYSEDYSPGNVVQYDHQLWAGARWIGPAGGHFSKDCIGLGYVRTAVGSAYRESILATTGKHLSAEHLVEANYQAHVTPWLLLQPVAQWFVKPDGDATRGLVFVAGFRTKITF
jgi:carbohydrate-selective porin OprB